MPTENVWSPDSHSLDAGRCRRCGSRDVRHLGNAHSRLDWLVCNVCSHVWGIADAATENASRRAGGRVLRERAARFVSHVLWRTGAVLCVALASASLVQAQTPQAAAPPQPAQGRVFASDAGIVLNFVKPEKTHDFEAIVTKLREALQKSDKPERKQQAASWKVMKALEPGANGSVLYMFVIDPAVKGADYTVSTILSEAFPQDVQALYKQYVDCYATGQNFVNLSLVSQLGQ